MKQSLSIDLFCGCGGFSLGIERAGFKTLAAIDNDPSAIKVFQANFPHVSHALCEDLTCFGPDKLAALTKVRTVELQKTLKLCCDQMSASNYFKADIL